MMSATVTGSSTIRHLTSHKVARPGQAGPGAAAGAPALPCRALGGPEQCLVVRWVVPGTLADQWQDVAPLRRHVCERLCIASLH